MLKILVAGEFPETPEDQGEFEEFAKCLGKAIINNDHAVVTLSESQFDFVLANSASQALDISGGADNAGKRIISYFQIGKPVDRSRFPKGISAQVPW